MGQSSISVMAGQSSKHSNELARPIVAAPVIQYSLEATPSYPNIKPKYRMPGRTMQAEAWQAWWISSTVSLLGCGNWKLAWRLALRANGSVLQPLGVVAGKDELDGAEKPFIEVGLMVREVLADAVADRNTAVLLLEYADGDAVDVKRKVRPPTCGHPSA